ncbi:MULTISPECIES: hypothetical protein [Haloferax]|uniref:Uncharacterized protein n=1 Tax=Haloferax sp. Atlit-48N TaxID=2077198 RepID=A0ACD5HYG4_9EURY|nr:MULTISPECIES: hypothetical protein [Haloferax]RDZ31152.1 hypothetical protein DEQ67_07020 [Haloferax sp. Atlit-48N]RDZ35284.1 hypothetical protein C5B88_12800 [Haloferax sp. Atlit-24N]RLM35694.1 hypothetical protein DVK03_12810 [Haloferax sp. Atlit-109R]RLM43543.1 hypothetical protein DVK04_12810 [Haloferax sp. Atlit-105R]WEL26816.1 GAF domain-containing protein fused to SAM (Sterile alpha motif) domain [Haloferax lucentense]
MTKSSIEDLAARIDELEERVDALETDTQQLEETVEAQAQTIASQREALTQYETRADDLEAKLDAASDHRKHLQQRLYAVESADTPTDESNTRRSPLQQLIRLPSQALSKLTANQERARFIAKDIREYATNVPAGFALDSSTIRTVLHAKEGQTPHTQTVSRVMDFLDDLGKEGVKIVKRRGTKRVIFTERAVSELAETSSASAGGSGITDVVMRWR